MTQRPFLSYLLYFLLEMRCHRMTDMRLVSLIEELAANAWPAYTQQSYGAWKLRATFGTTKRANSVFTAGPMPEHKDWLRDIERFYRRRGLPVCFYVSDASPDGLDAELAGQGYRLEMDCSLMLAKAGEVLERAGDSGRFDFSFAAEADDAWIHDFMKLEGFSQERLKGYQHIFSAIGPEKAFVRVLEDGVTVGLGTVVAERGFAGISNIIVDPLHRRKGIAGQLIRALAVWAKENEAERLYLQVIDDNTPAVMLYRKLGFERLSGHRYRIKPAEEC